jgi:hypothetical protein
MGRRKNSFGGGEKIGIQVEREKRASFLLRKPYFSSKISDKIR